MDARHLMGHSGGMGEVLPMPGVGDLFTDVRGGDRTMRVSYHEDRGVLVVSLWLGPVCRGSFRMAAGDVHKLIAALSEIETSIASAAAAAPDPDVQPHGEPSVVQTRDIDRTTLSSAHMVRVA
jgi:hypothetical protein